MAKQGKRIERMVERRAADYYRLCAEADRKMAGGGSKGFTKPGSRNLRKG